MIITVTLWRDYWNEGEATESNVTVEGRYMPPDRNTGDGGDFSVVSAEWACTGEPYDMTEEDIDDAWVEAGNEYEREEEGYGY
jgi:hypothetical protein